MRSIFDAYLLCRRSELICVDEHFCFICCALMAVQCVHFCACYSVIDAVLNYMWITLFNVVYGLATINFHRTSVKLSIQCCSTDFFCGILMLKSFALGCWYDVGWNAFNGFPAHAAVSSHFLSGSDMCICLLSYGEPFRFSSSTSVYSSQCKKFIY